MSLSFVVDINLGKLCKLLRMMGLDCKFLRTSEPSELVSVALRKDRIILTRRRNFPPVDELTVFVVTDDIPYNQAKEVVRRFGIDPLKESFTRCIECNAPLEKVPKDKVRGSVPSFIFRTREEFYRCPVCGKIFWRGSHKSEMQATLQRIKEEALKPPEV